MKNQDTKIMGIAAPAPRLTWQAAFMIACLLSTPVAIVSSAIALWP